MGDDSGRNPNLNFGMGLIGLPYEMPLAISFGVFSPCWIGVCSGLFLRFPLKWLGGILL